MSAATAPAAHEQEQQSDRLAALYAIHEAPVLWRAHEPGTHTPALSEALRAEADSLSAGNIPAHLQAGVDRRKNIVRGAIGALEDPSNTSHPHAETHRNTIIEELKNLPASRWEHDGPVIIAVPHRLLPLLDRLTLSVTKDSGIEIRLWDGCGDDSICIARDEGNGRKLLHLAGPGIPEDHLRLYQMLREGLWPAAVCERISNTL